jgi:hypothetical protein
MPKEKRVCAVPEWATHEYLTPQLSSQHTNAETVKTAVPNYTKSAYCAYKAAQIARQAATFAAACTDGLPEKYFYESGDDYDDDEYEDETEEDHSENESEEDHSENESEEDHSENESEEDHSENESEEDHSENESDSERAVNLEFPLSAAYTSFDYLNYSDVTSTALNCVAQTCSVVQTVNTHNTMTFSPASYSYPLADCHCAVGRSYGEEEEVAFNVQTYTVGDNDSAPYTVTYNTGEEAPSAESVSEPKPSAESVSEPKPSAESVSEPKPSAESVSEPKPSAESVSCKHAVSENEDRLLCIINKDEVSTNAYISNKDGETASTGRWFWGIFG